MRRALTVLLVVVLVGCGSSDDATSSSSTLAGSTTVAPTTTTSSGPPTTTTAGSSTTSVPGPTTTAEPRPQGPLEPDNRGRYEIRWRRLLVTPGFEFVDTDPDNPFWLIHTDAERDGFYFSLELYTTGYGALWEGELGEVEISCSEPPPGDNSTGVCPHFDPDGPGPFPDLVGTEGTGTITITRLDEDGYDITIDDITMGLGQSIRPFRVFGEANPTG